MKRLYLEIERTYMNPASYPEAVRTEDAHFHQSEEIAWKFLGTAERVATWAGILEEAEAAVPALHSMAAHVVDGASRQAAKEALEKIRGEWK